VCSSDLIRMIAEKIEKTALPNVMILSSCMQG
jgi:hypothetical protein